MPRYAKAWCCKRFFSESMYTSWHVSTTFAMCFFLCSYGPILQSCLQTTCSKGTSWDVVGYRNKQDIWENMGKGADLFNSCLQFCVQPHLSNIRFLQNQPLAWAMPLQIGCTSWSSVLAIFKASLCSLNLHVICVGRVSRNHTTGLLSTIQIPHNLGGHWVR